MYPKSPLAPCGSAITKINRRVSPDFAGALLVDPTGTRVAFAQEGRVVVTDIGALGQRRVLPVSGDAQVRLVFTSDGSILVQASLSVGGFGGIALVDPVSGVELATWLDDRYVGGVDIGAGRGR
jgi:hypothetical protein